MFPARLQRWARHTAEAIVTPLARIGVTPNVLTVTGFVFNVITACVIATGHISFGGLLVFLSGGFDMLDGALARVTKAASAFGAFLDSLLDRYSEAAILLALIYVFTIRHDTLAVLLVYAVAMGSILISYARARAEGLGLEAKVGIAPRPERVIILGLGLLLNFRTAVGALILLAVLTNVTALQRLYHVWRQTRDLPPTSTEQKATEPTPTKPRRSPAGYDGG